MSDIIHPVRAIAPGRIILRELEARGWSQQDLAAIMNRPEQMVSEIIRAKKQITAETARQLAKAFGTSPDIWLNLEMQYQLHQAVKEDHESEIQRRSRLYNLAPILEMIRRGWVVTDNNVNHLEQEYCRFFQVPTVDQNPQVAVRLRISEERGPEDRAIVTWAKRIEQLAMNQEVPFFTIESIPSVIDQLLAFTEKESDIAKIPYLLIDHGIHFVFVPHLPKTYLDGAALWVQDHPVIAVTMRYDRIDAFWFTFFHEIAHIYLQHQQVHVDQLFDRENQTLGQEEIEANEQATKWLVKNEAIQDFIDLNRPRYSRTNIERFASEQKRHPGIIIGQLMHRKELKFSHLREHLVKVRPILAHWEDVSYPK